MVITVIVIFVRWCNNSKKIKIKINNNDIKKYFSVIFVLFFTPMQKKSENMSISFYTGNFDFSDKKAKSNSIGFQHQNENLIEILFWKFSPLQVVCY